jgi:hypothetical protein
MVTTPRFGSSAHGMFLFILCHTKVYPFREAQGEEEVVRRLLTVNSIPLITVSTIIFYDWIVFELAKRGVIFSSNRTIGYHAHVQVTGLGVLALAVVPCLLSLGIGLVAWRSHVLQFVGFLALLPIVALAVGFFFLGFFGALCSLHDILACMSALY